MLILLTLIISAFCSLFIYPAFGRKVSENRRKQILASPNYRDGMFQNEVPTEQFTGEKGTVSALWKFLFKGSNNRHPQVPIPTVKTNLNNLSSERDWFVWFGHSSYLFSLNGKIFLVDPVLDLKFPVSLMLRPFKGTDIYRSDDLPNIDYLIITHEHWDHLDYTTLRHLRQKVKHCICPLGVGEYLEYWGYPSDKLTEMDWYEQACFDTEKRIQLKRVGDVKGCDEHSWQTSIVCLPTRHFSNRLFARNQTLWASYMVQIGKKQIYIGGDGGYDDRFLRIRQQFGEIDLAIMENGQYNMDWANVHLMPNDLRQAILDLQPKQVFTVHHNRFALAKHAWDEPQKVAQSIAENDSIVLLDSHIGQVVYW